MSHDEVNFNGQTLEEVYEDIIKQDISTSSPHSARAWYKTTEQFRSALKIEDIDDPDNDWYQLRELISDSTDFAGGSYPSVEQMLENAHDHFLKSLPYGAPTADTLAGKGELNEMWLQFLGTYVYITEAEAQNINDHDRLLSYEEFYEGYFGTLTGFKELLQEHYVEVLEETGNGDISQGFFLPSHNFEEWTEKVQRLSLTLEEGFGLTLANNSASEVAVIDRILRLLIEMVGILQNISASQADRLTFLTNWQRAYTELLSDVPVFTTAGSSGPLRVSEAVRDELNAKIGPYQENIRANRSLVQDDSKAMQSVINQSQDAANQQTNIGSSILQQLSTIVAAIAK